MGGRPRKPTALKILQGSFDRHPERRNHSEPMPEVAVPSCPSHMGVLGKNEWKRVTKELEKLGVISLADRAMIEQYCMAYESLREAIKAIKAMESPYYETEGGPREHPAVKAKRAYADQCIKTLVTLGLSPTARTRLAIKETKTIDPDEQLLFG
jgi:P27 family predicted phage terminase small subunit